MLQIYLHIREVTTHDIVSLQFTSELIVERPGTRCRTCFFENKIKNILSVGTDARVLFHPDRTVHGRVICITNSIRIFPRVLFDEKESLVVRVIHLRLDVFLQRETVTVIAGLYSLDERQNFADSKSVDFEVVVL